MATGIKDKIKTANDLLSQERPVPEWDVTLELRSPTVGTRRDILKAYTTVNAVTGEQEVDLVEMQFSLMLAMVYEPGGAGPLFEDSDREWLVEKNGSVVWGIAEECMTLAGFTNPDPDAANGPVDEQVDAGKALSSTTPASETS
jgi:hypothetical protein